MPRYNSSIDEKDGAILQAVRLAATLFLAEIRSAFGLNGMNPVVQTEKLRIHLERSEGNWGELRLLRLWCLAIGGIESEGSLKSWIAREVRGEGAMMGLGSWKEIEEMVREVLWYEECHTPAFVDLGLGALTI